MKLIDQIRSYPQEKKIRIIWSAALAAAIILIITWVVTSRFSDREVKQSDTRIFNTIGQSFNNLKNDFHLPPLK